MTTESQVNVYGSREPEKFLEEVRDYLEDIQTVRSVLPVGARHLTKSLRLYIEEGVR